MKVFLSYRFADETLVQSISYYLTKQSDLEPYFYGNELHSQNWVAEVGEKITEAGAFLLFVGTEVGNTQLMEALAILNLPGERQNRLIKLPGFAAVPAQLALFAAFPTVEARGSDERSAQECARAITTSLGKQWVPVDDIPEGYAFDYEKDIINAYNQDVIDPELIGKGCPRHWPEVTREECTSQSPLKEEDVGLFRDSLVLAGALKESAADVIRRDLCFPEAGPRNRLAYPTLERPRTLRVGVLVSGGIAPGINAVIAGIVERHFLYAESGRYETGLIINGYHNGLKAIYHSGLHSRPLTPEDVAARADRSGSILGTARLPEFMSSDPLERRNALERAVNHLSADGIQILYIIGGDGSMRAAHALWKTAERLGRKISVVGIPKAMDNDILWVWQSFGFLSAVECSRELIQQLHTEAKSNPRLCVMQLFGSDSGFVVTHAVSASGVCDLFLVPEVPFTMKVVCNYIAARLRDRYMRSGPLASTYGMIVMAETAIPRDAEDYFDNPKVNLTNDEKEAIRDFLKTKRVFGQTPDELRSGGLKLVSRVIQEFIKQSVDVLDDRYWRQFRVFTNEPRHLIRAIAPSTSDTIIAKRLGSLAVDGAMAGYTDFMISQWLTEYVMVPLRLVVLGRKRIPRYGIFYKAARASTGQPSDLGDEDAEASTRFAGHSF